MMCLCDKSPDDTIDDYKDFVQILRRKELEEPFLTVSEETSEKLKEYVKLLLDQKFSDEQHHSYFGLLKKVMTSFLIYHAAVIDDVIKEADHVQNVITRNDLSIIVDKTLSMQEAKQEEFRKSFVLATNEWEKKMFEEIETAHSEHMEQLSGMKETIKKLDRPCLVEEFAKEAFAKTVKRMSVIFDTANLFMGKLLVDRIRPIRVSLEEILLRLRNNLSNLKAERDETVYQLLNQIYDKNKETLAVSRGDKKNSIALAENTRAVDDLRIKIENSQLKEPIDRLETEVQYWTEKVEYFNEIASNIASLRDQQKETFSQQKEYHYLRCRRLPGCQNECRRMFRLLYSQRQEEIRQRIVHETRAMVTFFAFRGTDRILYSDNVGPYYIDEYDHQNYMFDFSLSTQHVDCNGRFVSKNVSEHAYKFDKYGRYIEKNGEKLYQCAPCTSLYNLNEGHTLDKVTKDCGHSERLNENCKMDRAEPPKVILPDFKPIDIKKTLPDDTVKYLWDCFGCILPEALYNCGKVRPKNPIHFIAHKLLDYKYGRTRTEFQQKKIEAEKFRAEIYNKRKKKAEEASRAWKSKQVKKRKPEESDDADVQAARDVTAAEELFIMALNRDYGN